jgi:indolepyruvate ferredoxin oxidoreductase
MRVPDLIDYQSAAYAREYVDFVERVRAAEAAAVPGDTRLSEGVARHLFKLMAYKHEYEVARLHLRPDMVQALHAQFPAGARVQYNLHPPLLRALGMKRKIKLGTWFDGAFRLLRGLKRLRGTPFDPFGYAEVRRVERALIGEYRSLVDKALAGLTPGSYGRAVKIANLPDVIRGYEDIKLGNVRRYRAEVQALNI